MALLALRHYSKHNRTTAPTRWALIVAGVLSVHVGVLAVGRSGAFGGAEIQQIALSLQMLDDDQPLSALEYPVKPPAEFLTSLTAADSIETLPPPSLVSDVRPGHSVTQRSSAAREPLKNAGDDISETGRGEISFQSDDVPLSAEPLAPEQSSAAAGSAGGVAGFNSAGDKKNEKGSFAKLLNAMAPPAPREALRLPGKPAYPRACRQGLCRNGQPCEGSSQWQISVSAAGGKPLKIECLKKMDCELQNASIRKFFAESKFAPTNEDAVYVFPVTMNTHQ